MLSNNFGMEYIWVFNGERSCFPSGVFLSRDIAEKWIGKHSLTGILTRYPVNQGAYDYAVASQLFCPRKPDHKSPAFIGKFSCAGFEHYHYEDGELD